MTDLKFLELSAPEALAYEVFKSLEEFKSVVKAAGLAERVRYLRHAETYEFQVREGSV